MAQTIGEKLKQARLARQMTIEQASQATHIRPHFLEALENDQRDALPSAVQGRGFLRLYAGLLDLPVHLLLAAWDGKTTIEPIEPATPVTNELTPEPPAPGSPREISPITETQAPEEAGELPEDLPGANPLPVQDLSFQPQETDPGSSSAAVFREIGQTLRQQREALGLTAAEVERYTRLRQHYIQILEEGRIDELPSTVQGRGMLSNYAAFLNLDEEKIMLGFAEGLQIRRVERLPKPEPQTLFTNKKRPARQAPIWRRFLTPDLIFGVGVAAIILFFTLWTAARITSLRKTETQPTPPGIGQMLLTPDTSQTLGATTPLAGTALPGQTAGVGNGEIVPPPASSPEPGQASRTEQPSSGASADGTTGNSSSGAPAGPATIQPINKDPVQVYIIAKQRAWLRVVADDKVKFLGRTVPGNAYAFSGSKRVDLLTGNAAGLQVFYNQNDLGSLGTSGQVVGFVFSPDRMMTPTAAFTPTSLPTKPATVTPLPTLTPQATPTITPYVPK